MVVDDITEEYRRPCVFYPGQVVPTDIIWRFAAPGALVLPVDTVFWAYRFVHQLPPHAGVGEVYGSRWTTDRRKINVRPLQPGLAYDGTPADFLGLGVPPASVLVAGGALPRGVCAASPAIGLVGGQQRPIEVATIGAGVAWSAEV